MFIQILFVALVSAKHMQLSHQVSFEAEKEVIILNLDNFDAAVMRYEVLLVDFFAPWCPHCQRLMPEYEAAAAKLRKEEIHLAKVDCTMESKLCQRFEVRGYPTLRIFYHNKIFHYHGHRDRDGIYQFMVEHLKEQQRLEQQ